jgi:hypothetical protein
MKVMSPASFQPEPLARAGHRPGSLTPFQGLDAFGYSPNSASMSSSVISEKGLG